MTPQERAAARATQKADAAGEAWVERQLRKAPPMTQEQIADVRRLLLRPAPLSAPPQRSTA